MQDLPTCKHRGCSECLMYHFISNSNCPAFPFIKLITVTLLGHRIYLWSILAGVVCKVNKQFL